MKKNYHWVTDGLKNVFIKIKHENLKLTQILYLKFDINRLGKYKIVKKVMKKKIRFCFQEVGFEVCYDYINKGSNMYRVKVPLRNNFKQNYMLTSEFGLKKNYLCQMTESL